MVALDPPAPVVPARDGVGRHPGVGDVGQQQPAGQHLAALVADLGDDQPQRQRRAVDDRPLAAALGRGGVRRALGVGRAGQQDRCFGHELRRRLAVVQDLARPPHPPVQQVGHLAQLALDPIVQHLAGVVRPDQVLVACRPLPVVRDGVGLRRRRSPPSACPARPTGPAGVPGPTPRGPTGRPAHRRPGWRGRGSSPPSSGRTTTSRRAAAPRSPGENATSSPCKPAACRPASRAYRMTVSSLVPTSRPVRRMPHPSRTWARIEVTFAAGRWDPKKTVPRRSLNRDLHARHRSRRYWPSLPIRAVTVRLPPPRLPCSAQDGVWHPHPWWGHP